MSSVNNKEKNFISAVVYLHNDGARAVEFCRAVAAEPLSLPLWEGGAESRSEIRGETAGEIVPSAR